MTKEAKSVWCQWMTVLALTALSGVTGLARQVTIAWGFGAQPVLDEFYVAQTLIGAVFGTVDRSVGSVVVPAYARAREQQSLAAADQYAVDLLSVAVWASSALAAVLLVFAPGLAPLLAPGFTRTELVPVALALRLMAPGLVAMSAAAVVSGVSQARQRFVQQSLMYVPRNLLMIADAFVGRVAGVAGLAVATTMGAAGQVAVFGDVPRVRAPWRVNWHDPALRDTLGRVPAVFAGLFVAQVAVVADRVLGSFLPTGTIAELTNASALVLFASNLLATLGTVLFPRLADAAAQENYPALRRQVVSGTFLAAILGVAACGGGLLFGSSAVVNILLDHGAWSALAASDTARYVDLMLPGMAGVLLVSVPAKALLSLGSVREILSVALTSVVVTVGTDLVLIGPYQGAGLAIGFSVGALFNALMTGVMVARLLRIGEHRLGGV